MHLENHRVKKVVPTLYALVMLCVMVFFFLNELYDFMIWLNLFVYLFLIGIFILIHKYLVFFKYDSSTNLLIFKNSGLFLSNVLEYRTKTLSIERGKLIKFKITNCLIGYKLRLTFKQNFETQTQIFLFSFVNKKRIKDLKYSLTKALENN
jgi:hypothetical protein